MNALRFAVIGSPPRTKKNSPRVFNGRPLPSKAWTEWRDSAVFALEDGRIVMHPPRWEGGPANIEAHFYLDKRHRADANGLYQGLADLLQDRGCVADDRVFISWWRSRTHDPVTGDCIVDKTNPRVEVVITEAAQEVAA